MRIHYRVIGEQIEIIRCFGADPQIVLPERIEGLPVVRTAAYAFSDRKGAEEEDVRIFESALPNAPPYNRRGKAATG